MEFRGIRSLADLKQLYALMEYLKRTDLGGLVFHGIPLNEQTVLATCGDCSWANAQDFLEVHGTY